MEELEKLFGSAVRLKLLKLFLFNPNNFFSISSASARVIADNNAVRKEVSNLVKAGFLKKTRSTKASWGLDPRFPYLKALTEFFTSADLLGHDAITRRASKLGKVQLFFLSGFFIGDRESRIDLFMVGDGIKKHALKKFVDNLEAQVGREIRYAYFTTADFKYRYVMFDKLIRDVLDFPHRKLINKLNI